MEKKKINWTRVVLIAWTIIGVVGTIVTLPWYLNTKNKVVYGFLMVFIVLAYEFLMRIILGIFIIKIKFNPQSKWFKVRKFELKIYNALKLKKWVNHSPTFNPDQYDAKIHTVDEIIENTCKNEVSHEVYYILTYVPIIWGIFLGYLPFCIIQALIVCQTDAIFISMQRYNRNRLMRLSRKIR